MMKLEIKRISINEINLNTFVNEFLTNEQPFILTGVEVCEDSFLTPQNMKNYFGKDDKKGLGWYNSPIIDTEYFKTPEIVRRVMRRSDMSFRKMPMRIFMQPGGHITLPHYDGNSIHVFNLQAKGRKKWTLISSHTPMVSMPFMYAAMVPADVKYDTKKYDVMEVETRPGEMLFVPRYWSHEVETLDTINMNFTWVFTPCYPDEKSPLGRRESEVIKLRKSFPIINKAFFPDDINEYGGQGQPIIDQYTEGVGNFRVMMRLLKELAKYPRLPFVLGGLKKRANAFKLNNFNVDHQEHPKSTMPNIVYTATEPVIHSAYK